MFIYHEVAKHYSVLHLPLRHQMEAEHFPIHRVCISASSQDR